MSQKPIMSNFVKITKVIFIMQNSMALLNILCRFLDYLLFITFIMKSKVKMQ